MLHIFVLTLVSCESFVSGETFVSGYAGCACTLQTKQAMKWSFNCTHSATHAEGNIARKVRAIRTNCFSVCYVYIVTDPNKHNSNGACCAKTLFLKSLNHLFFWGPKVSNDSESHANYFCSTLRNKARVKADHN